MKNGFVDYLLNDALSHIDGLSSKRMFSGYGIYKDGIIFGLVVAETLYLKTDVSTRSDFEALQSKPFSYEKKTKKVMITSYWSLPEHIIENRDLVREWIDKAVEVSYRSKKR